MRPLPTGEPWGDYAVSTALWGSTLLHDVLQRARPAANGVDVRLEGADHSAYHVGQTASRGARSMLMTNGWTAVTFGG